MRKNIAKAIASATAGLFLAVTALAAPPEYDEFELQARASFGTAYNLPSGAFFTNSTSAINDNAEVGFKLVTIPDADVQGVWFGSNGVGEIVYTSAEGAFFSDVDLNNPGVLVFEQYFSAQDGIYSYDTATEMGGLLTTQPLGASGWGSVQMNEAGEVGYRANFLGDHAWVSYDGSDVAYHAVEVSIDPDSPYSFLFTPSFNDLRQIAGKVRLGPPGEFGEERPDQIRIFSSDGTSMLIAEDQDSNPASQFVSFDNSVSLTNTGWVAFHAELADGNRGVFFANHSFVIEIAVEGDGQISALEFFGPSANESGDVAFRAFDSSGLRAVWVGDGEGLTHVIGEHDLIMTDLGEARVDQNDSSPVFGGGVRINELGDVVFHASLTPPDNNQVEWGSGVFIAYAQQGMLGDMDCDGDVDFDDIDPFVLALSGEAAYEAEYPDCNWLNADVDLNGMVDFDDINPFVNLIGS